MLIEQDYIMRMIQQLIQVLLKEILKRKEKTLEESVKMSDSYNQKYQMLKEMVDEYKIDKAENILFDTINTAEWQDFEVALLFYQYINQKEDDFLQKANYTREEIQQGIRDVAKQYGYQNVVDLFLS